MAASAEIAGSSRVMQSNPFSLHQLPNEPVFHNRSVSLAAAKTVVRANCQVLSPPGRRRRLGVRVLTQ